VSIVEAAFFVGSRPRTQRNRRRGLLACFGAGLSVILSASFSLGCAGGANEAVTVTEQVSVREETVTVVKTETAPDDSVSVPELIAEAESGIVRIETEDCAGKGHVGTGFLIAPELVATVEHVVAGARRIVLKQKGESVSDRAQVVGADSFRDVALIRSGEPIDGHVFTLAEQDPRLGEEVAALGFPLGGTFPTFDVTVTRGSVSGLHRTVNIDGVERTRLIQTDAAINPGNSGGPLISLETAEVVSIADAIANQDELPGAEGFSWGVNVEVAAPLLEAWGRGSTAASTRSICSDESELPLTTFAGDYFSISYPDSWKVEAGELSKGSYLDTTVRNPEAESVMIRVDVAPGQGGVDALVFASRVEESLKPQPGYERIAFKRVGFQGYDAVWWEFVVEESGVSLHKVDLFFVGEHGDVFAVLTQAPSPDYADWSALFDEVRNSLSVASS
jgi:S1-C subfamily serine protease